MLQMETQSGGKSLKFAACVAQTPLAAAHFW